MQIFSVSRLTFSKKNTSPKNENVNVFARTILFSCENVFQNLQSRYKFNENGKWNKKQR